MPKSANKAATKGFPNFNLCVPYIEGLRYVQCRLKMFDWGDLKPFAETHKLTYTQLVSLKNGTLQTERPRLVQQMLAKFNIPTERIRTPRDNKQQFLFPSQEALDTFREQLKTFDQQATS